MNLKAREKYSEDNLIKVIAEVIVKMNEEKDPDLETHPLD